MTIRLPPEKISKVLSLANSLLTSKSHTVYDLASFIGVLVSSFPGVKYGPLHYRALELDKCAALRHNKGCYNGFVTL